MWANNLRILGVVLGTLALYTLIANKIPQVQSEVPQALSLGANVTFNVRASGTSPFGYQWRYNDAAIPDATAISLGSVLENGYKIAA